MQLDQLREHVDQRFDRLEDKLDQYARDTIKNTNDLTWVKGAVTIGLTGLLSIIGYLLTQLIQSK